MTELTMPRLSDSMEEGTILTWLKGDGEHVEAGEDLLEIETDKATVTHQAETGGVLQIIASEGSTLPVGAPIARVGGEAADGQATPSAPDRSSADARSAPAVPSPPVSTSPPAVPAGRDSNGSGTAVRATPLARRAASVHGVSLEDVAGTGPLGRVTHGDVLNKAGIAPARDTSPPAATPSSATPAPSPPAAAETPSPSPPPTAGTAAPTGKGTVEVVEPTRVQSLIARRMAEAKATIPHFQVQTDVAMDAAVTFRTQVNEAEGARAVSLNDLVVKAAGLALRRHSLVNASYRDGHFEIYSRVNVGIAVAADRALVVPTIFDADEKSLVVIAGESKRLAERVRNGEITPAELSGATFSVSNLGMYGMTTITPVINPPQAAILGAGAVREVLRRVDGEIVDGRAMTLTLSCDHRILHGADAAEFLSMIRELLEQPLRLTL
jgi:pyruvate dehydrogenase E2 component (dihydrolipoamide acetyltransferase)